MLWLSSPATGASLKKNGSSGYNYDEWNKKAAKRRTAYKKDTRKATSCRRAAESDPQLRVVSKVGGLMIFSAAQMHSTVP